MNQAVQTFLPFLVIPLVILFWLLITSVFSAMSGWFGLMRRFPDRPEKPRVKLGGLSGVMGAGVMGSGVNFGGVLTLSACASGLRVSVWRIFGPFSKPFFVPWDQITVTRRRRMFWDAATFSFGRSEEGRLEVRAYVADRLAAASQGGWPEPGQFVAETRSQATGRIFRDWLVATAFAATFFAVVPRLFGGPESWPPIPVAILFPAIFFGIGSLIRFFQSR